jgi:hypothetical protein
VAIACDVPLPAAPIPILHLDDVEGIAEMMLRKAAPIDRVPAPAI